MKTILKKIIKSEDLKEKAPLIIEGQVFYQYRDYDGVKELHITEKNVRIIQEYDGTIKETNINPTEEYIISIKIEAESNKFMKEKLGG